MKLTLSRTKIIATIGPACSTIDLMRRMVNEGVDVFRVNFSHSGQEDFLKYSEIIRELNRESSSEISLLADLQGPKLRVGEIENGYIDLVEDDLIRFVTEKCTGNKDHLYISYTEFPGDVKPGEFILIDDGKIKLEVVDTDRTGTVKTRVVYGGRLSSKKGVNLPNTAVSIPSLTDEDISNAVFAIENGVDWIALSFVRSASDITGLKELVRKHGGKTGIISKIEKPEALYEIDRIIELSDGIMVARGDLGVEMPFEEVPVIQKTVVKKCIEQSKPVIIATQIMESMINSFMPTRAESNDVANAVIDGADALMLSGETSVGKFPVETIRNMQRVIYYTESNGGNFIRKYKPVEATVFSLADSICLNAVELAREIDARVIVTFTHSGHTALRISGYRPDADIFAFTDNRRNLWHMTLVRGVRAFYLEKYENFEEAIVEAVNILKGRNLVDSGERVVFVGSIPLNEHGKTNIIKAGYV